MAVIEVQCPNCPRVYNIDESLRGKTGKCKDCNNTFVIGGTYEFMCREQVAHYRDSGPAVDVWSLATTLYYLLSGHTPRDFGDGDRCLAVLEVDPTPLAQRRNDLPPRLASVIDAALKEEPTMAFQSATAFKAALEEV